MTDYDVINRGGAHRPHPPMTLSGLHDPTSDQDYSILEENYYHVLEPSNSCGEEYSGVRNNGKQDHGVIDHEQKEQDTPNGDAPQDYEIPTPRTSRVQNTYQ